MSLEFGINVVRIPLIEADVEPASYDLGLPLGEFTGTQEDMQTLVLNAVYDGLLDAQRRTATEAYLLTWRGTKRVPAGAIIGDHVIVTTQHGRVMDHLGEQFGTYQRVKDVTGPDLESEMLVFPFPMPAIEK